jgi:putative oxidoreductase
MGDVMTTTYVAKTADADADLRAMAGVSDALLAVGRVFIAVMFILSGAQKFMDITSVASELGSKGFPMPQLFAVATATLELGGGLLVIVGWQTRWVALALAAFVLAAAYFFHDFWHMPQGAERQDAVIHALKNLSIFGGFLMLAAVGPGRYSIDGPCTVHQRKA